MAVVAGNGDPGTSPSIPMVTRDFGFKLGEREGFFYEA